MTDLVGSSLYLQIPVSSLKMMGHIEGTEELQSFFEKVFIDRWYSLFTSEQISRIEDYLPYMGNMFLIPSVITEMIEKNITFTEACESAMPIINENIMQFLLLFKMFELDDSLKSSFDVLIDGIFEIISEMLEKDADTSAIDCISVNLTNLSYNTIIAMQLSGITSISHLISQKANVIQSIEETMVIPSRQIITDCLSELPDFQNMEEEELSELNTQLQLSYESFFKSLPLQTILSLTLTKAINDNLTLQQALSSFDFNDLVNSTIEKILNTNDISKYEKSIKNLLNLLLNAEENF